MILAGNTLYGTTVTGYNQDSGTIFSVNTDGTGIKTLYDFTATSGTISTNSDGAFPFPRLVYSDNTLYGMATKGGLYGAGTLFSLSLPIVSPPPLTITSAGTNVLLAWPTNAVGFTLEFASNLGSPTSLEHEFNDTGHHWRAKCRDDSRFQGSKEFYRLSH